MISRCAQTCGRTKLAGWSVAVLVTAAVAAGERPASSAQSDPPMPPAQRSANAPAAAVRKAGATPASSASARRPALPAAFTQATPRSIADLKAIEQHIKALVPRLSPAVVAVQVGDLSGSGVVVSVSGLVLTAGHLCGAREREVQFTFPNGRTAWGKTLGANRDSDAGLLQITDYGKWPQVEVGDLAGVRPGDWVLALGHPGGFDARRSLVVRLGRIIRCAPGALQTDCPISGGDSGGALFDMHGRVIGIHSSISGAATENFHVPITRYAESWDRLLKGQP